MSVPKFNNRPSDHVRYSFNSPSSGVKTSQDYFVSRAPAIVGAVFAQMPEGLRVLITRRSDKMRDEPGKICMPCGYLDWDESGYEGMEREVYEETSLNLRDYQKFLKFDNNRQPFLVKTDPKDNRQNITLIYVSLYDFSFNYFEFPRDIELFTCKEVSMVKWLKMREYYDQLTDIQWAFGHDLTINNANDFLYEKVKL
jgi:8-oxo-dGTP pyrophosphatase MutT (NUDIX family)